jgi:hypothetical protein
MFTFTYMCTQLLYHIHPPTPSSLPPFPSHWYQFLLGQDLKLLLSQFSEYYYFLDIPIILIPAYNLFYLLVSTLCYFTLAGESSRFMLSELLCSVAVCLLQQLAFRC